MRPSLPRTRLRALLSVLVFGLLASGCDGETPEAAEPAPLPVTLPAEPLPEAEDPETPARAHQRNLVFLSRDADSTMVVPWTFHGVRAGASEVRGRGVWLARGGGWEQLVQEADEGGAHGSGWQILPGPGVGLVVGPEGGLQSLRLRDAPPELRTRVGILLADWSAASRETVRFHQAVTELDGEEVAGFLLDQGSITESGQQPRGDWIFLHGGDVFQGFFQAVTPARAEDPVLPTWMGWTRIAVRERRWSALEVVWDEMRAFEDARRDIPTRWELRSPEGELEVTLESVGSYLEAGAGEGALLPVDAFFTVRGEARFEGDTVAVHGVVRHRQP
ncbi:MAG: hypothetical protein EA422_13245 [Gemmatimonadales bacterium]|nr:MAG: hypothetical protein EA422_13245 [Gemmatimonadales bacterium]